MAANKNKARLGITLLFIVYLIILAYFLFFAESFGRTDGEAFRGLNLVPFQEIRRSINIYRNHKFSTLGLIALINVVGNVIAFIPMGYFIPRVSRKVETFASTVISSFLVSFIVEVLQYETQKGSCDIDDLILNTLGGMCGYLIFHFLHKYLPRLKRRRKSGGK